MINVAARLALRTYPPSFQERYGCELEALVEDTGDGPRAVADLLIGALRAWLHPVMPDESAERCRRRLQASVATTWVSWCAALYVLPVLHLVLSDQLSPASADVVRPLFELAQYAMGIGGLIPLVGAFPLLAETFSTGNWAAWRPLVAPVALLPAGFLGVFILMVLVEGPASWLLALGWLGPAAFLIAVAVAPAAVVTRCRPSAKVLRLLALLGVAMAFAVTTMCIASVTTVMAVIRHASDASGQQLMLPVLLPILAVTVAASAVAVVSSGRGAKAALQHFESATEPSR